MMVMDYLRKPALFLTLISSLALAGCGGFNDLFGRIDKKGSTPVSIGTQSAREHGLLSPFTCGSPCFNGGLMVYAVRDDGLKQAAMMSSEGQLLNLSLLNGNYTFYAYGWDTGSLTTSFSRCGVAGPVSLSGTATDVTLTMSQAACTASTAFAPSYAYATGSPQQLASLTLGFCARNTNVSAFSAGSNCPAGAESSMLFKGNSSSSVGEGDYVSASNTVVFAAAVSSSSLPELFATPMDTNLQRKINPPLPAGATGVKQVIAIPGTTRLVYTADQATAGKDELFMADLSNNTTVKISQSAPAGSVKAVRVGKAGGKPYAVFAGDMQTASLVELYSVDVSTTTPPAPVKISGTMVGSAAGIYNCTSCAGGGWQGWRFDMSTNVHPEESDGTTANTLNPYVVYIADQTTVGARMVYIASFDGNPLPGSTPTGTVISGAEITAAADYADQFAFSYDGQYVAYHAHQSTSLDGIYFVKFNSAAAPSATYALCPVASCGAQGPYLKMAHGVQKIAYNTTGTYPTLWIADLSNPAGMNYQVLQATAGANETGYARYRFTPDDSRVVAATMDVSNVVHNIRTVDTAPTANLTGVTPELIANPATGSIRSTKPPSGGEYFAISPDSTKVVYAADQNTVNIVELFYAPVGAAASSVAISGTVPAASNSVVSYGFLGSTPYFAAALNTAGFNELYSTALTASPTVTRLNSGTVAGSILNIDDGRPVSNVLLYNANPPTALGGTNKEMYAYNVTTGVHSRITKLYGGSGGIGRVQVSALSYGQAFTSGATYTPVIQSACLGPASIDGMTIPTSVKIPIGSGVGDSPFAYEVDVYPQATSCSGTPIKYIFPSGLANFASAPNGAYMNVVGNGAGTLDLYVKDF